MSSAQAASDAATVTGLVERIVAGETRAGARAMRWADDEHRLSVPLLKALFPHTGKAKTIGITGNPGSGKSTLTAALIAHFRAQGRRVGIVAVDPSSPFSGGAILGDRIRMNAHATDPDTFIRSMATRGHLGGLSRSTHDVVAVMDAMGFDPIIIETVGVGQDEVEVIKLAHTSVVVVVPGLGDDIQAIKAGLLEVADVFAINKADREGVEHTARDIRVLQSLDPDKARWRPPIVRTVATTGSGVQELVDAIASHQARHETEALQQRARQRETHILEQRVVGALLAHVQQLLGDESEQRSLAQRLVDRETDPYSEADRLLKSLGFSALDETGDTRGTDS